MLNTSLPEMEAPEDAGHPRTTASLAIGSNPLEGVGAVAMVKDRDLAHRDMSIASASSGVKTKLTAYTKAVHCNTLAENKS